MFQLVKGLIYAIGKATVYRDLSGRVNCDILQISRIDTIVGDFAGDAIIRGVIL